MGGICNRLSRRCIQLDVQANDMEQVCRELVELLASEHHILDTERLLREILERESLATTCIGTGTAVPHAHSDTVKQSLIAAARLAPAADLGAPDGVPVTLVFLLVGPPSKAMVHLKLLSKLARLLHDHSFKDRLLTCTSAEQFHTLMCTQEERA